MQYELLTIREVAATVRMSVSTIHRLVRIKEFPAPIRIGPASTRWRADELRAWLDNRSRSIDDSDAPAATGPSLAA